MNNNKSLFSVFTRSDMNWRLDVDKTSLWELMVGKKVRHVLKRMINDECGCEVRDVGGFNTWLWVGLAWLAVGYVQVDNYRQWVEISMSGHGVGWMYCPSLALPFII